MTDDVCKDVAEDVLVTKTMASSSSERRKNDDIIAAHHYIGESHPRPLSNWQTRWYEDASDAFLCLGKSSFMIRYCSDNDQHDLSYNDDLVQAMETTEEMIHCVKTHLASEPINILAPSSIVIQYMDKPVNPDFCQIRQYPNTLPALIKHVYAMQCSKEITDVLLAFSSDNYKISCMIGQLLNGLFFVYTFAYKYKKQYKDFVLQSSLVVAREYSTLVSHGLDVLEHWRLDKAFKLALAPVLKPVVVVRTKECKLASTLAKSAETNTETKTKVDAHSVLLPDDSSISFELVVPTSDGRKRTYQSLHIDDPSSFKETKQGQDSSLQTTKRCKTETEQYVLGRSDAVSLVTTWFANDEKNPNKGAPSEKVESKVQTELSTVEKDNIATRRILYEWLVDTLPSVEEANVRLAIGKKGNQSLVLERMMLATIATMKRNSDTLNQFIVLEGSSVKTVSVYLGVLIVSQFVNLDIVICAADRDVASNILRQCLHLYVQQKNGDPGKYAKRLVQCQEHVLSFRKRHLNQPYDTNVPPHDVIINGDYWSIRTEPIHSSWLPGDTSVPDILICVDISPRQAHEKAMRILENGSRNGYPALGSLVVFVVQGDKGDKDDKDDKSVPPL